MEVGGGTETDGRVAVNVAVDVLDVAEGSDARVEMAGVCWGHGDGGCRK